MNKSVFFLLLGLLMMVQTKAQVTFSEHIAPIIYDNCTSCHRAGEIAPFPLTNYEEVSSWKGMIQYTTEIKYMPPWKPDPNYSHFVGESGLTAEEIQLIADWVDAGAPQGNPALEPPLPFFPTGSQLGTPDLVLKMEEVYFIEGNNTDDYRVFVLPTGLAEDKEIAAIEFRPGNNQAVHHALIAYETEGVAAKMAEEAAGYGYESFGSFGVPVQGSFTGYTPGIKNILFPKGIGTTLPAGADILLHVHYAPLPTDETDQSLVNIFFKKTTDPIEREVIRGPISPLNLDDGFFSFVIPPDEVTNFHGAIEVENDISLIAIYPHSHYLGKSWEIFAETSTNDTIPIIRIKDWDFNWQGAYTFDRMKKIPAGSTIHANAIYDNTIDNPFNPSFPPQESRWGEKTTDEMFLAGMAFVPYQEGDEDIVIGENLTTSINEVISDAGNQLYLPYPNPANTEVSMSFYLKKSQSINMEIFDIKGRLVKTIINNTKHPAGNHKVEFNVGQLSAGLYTIRLGNEQMALTRPLVVAD